MNIFRVLSIVILLSHSPTYPQPTELAIRIIAPNAALNQDYLAGKGTQYQGVLSQIQKPHWNSHFWLIGDVFPQGNMDNTGCFQLFVTDSLINGHKIWAAGYSPQQGQIQLLEAKWDSIGNPVFTILACKDVYIRSPENKYVIKTIFYHRKDKIKIEVNGVPMRCEAPFDSEKITMAGFAVFEGIAKFKALKYEGENQE